MLNDRVFLATLYVQEAISFFFAARRKLAAIWSNLVARPLSGAAVRLLYSCGVLPVRGKRR